MAHYIIFGDSIAYGEGDLSGGWVQCLREALTDDIVYNLGIDGETTTGLINRLEKEIKPRLSEDDPNIVVIALGVNDSAFSSSANQCQVPLGDFKKNLLQLIKLGKKYTDKIILISPAPIDQVKVDPVPWAPEMSYKIDLVKQYCEAMKAAANQEKVKFVDLINRLGSEYLTTLDDGVHPDRQGHEKIYRIVVKNIKMC